MLDVDGAIAAICKLDPTAKYEWVVEKVILIAYQSPLTRTKICNRIYAELVKGIPLNEIVKQYTD